MFSIDNIIFALGGNGVSLLELVSVVTGLLCVFLAGRNKKFNFWVGYLYNILLFVMFAQKHLYSAMLLQPVAFAINFFGQWRWSHPREGEESAANSSNLKVSTLTWEQRGWSLLFVAGAGLVWGFVLSKLGTSWFKGTFAPDPTPWLDAVVLMLTLLAQFLSAQKKWDCWIVWLMVNIANICLYLSAGLSFMPIVSGLYLINGIWSLFTWYRLYKKNI